MDNIVVVIKQHPIPVVIGVVILLLLISNKNSQASTGNGASIAERQIAANSNSQIAGINAQTAVAIGAQNADVSKAAMASATQRTSIAASLFAAVTGTNAAVGMNDSVNLVKSIQIASNRADNNQQFANQLQLGEDTIKAGILNKSNELEAQITMGMNDNNAKLAQLGKITSGNLQSLVQTGKNASDLAIVNGGVASGLLGQSLAFQDKNLSTILQHSENSQRISGDTATMLAQINTKAANTAADSAAHAQNVKNDQSWLSSIGNVVSSLFSF